MSTKPVKSENVRWITGHCISGGTLIFLTATSSISGNYATSCRDSEQ